MENSKMVTVHYKGTLDDGSVFDSSYDRGESIRFVEGAHMMIPGFERAVNAMQPGEKATVHIEPKDAYGDYDERNVQVVPVDQIPNGDKLPVGQTVFFRSPIGAPMPALIQKIEDGKVYIDFNHSLAGKALNFEIELISREDAPATQCGTGSCEGCSGCH